MRSKPQPPPCLPLSPCGSCSALALRTVDQIMLSRCRGSWPRHQHCSNHSLCRESSGRRRLPAAVFRTQEWLLPSRLCARGSRPLAQCVNLPMCRPHVHSISGQALACVPATPVQYPYVQCPSLKSGGPGVGLPRQHAHHTNCQQYLGVTCQSRPYRPHDVFHSRPHSHIPPQTQPIRHGSSGWLGCRPDVTTQTCIARAAASAHAANACAKQGERTG